MAIGDIGHWRDSAGGQLPGTTFAGFNFASQQRNDNSTYSKPNDSTIEIEEAGDYLIIGHIVGTDGDNGRHGPQGRLNLTTGTGDLFTSYISGFNRNNANNDWSLFFFGLYLGGAANDQIQIQVRRDADVVANPGSTANASDVQIVRLGDNWNYGLYQSNSAGNAYGGTTPNDVAFGAAPIVETDTAVIELQANDTDIRLKSDNARFLIGYAVAGDTGGSRTQRLGRLVTGSTEIDGSRSYFYQRNGSNEFTGLGALVLHETATADEDISVQVYRGDGVAANDGGADVDGSWVNNSGEETAVFVVELPDHVEVFASVDGTAGQDVAGGVTTTINAMRTVNFNDSASFTAPAIDTMDVAVAMDALVWANIVTARATVGSGTRFEAGARVEIAGVDQTTGRHTCYTRGNQSTQDTFGGSWHPGAIFTFTAGQDVQYEIFDSGDNGADDTTRANEVGAFAINLDTLEATDNNNTSELPVGAVDVYSGNAPQIVATENRFSNVSVGNQAYIGQIPNAISTDVNDSLVPLGTETYSGFVPSVTASENRFTALVTGAHSFTGLNPQSVTTENNSSAIPAGTINFAVFNPESVTTENNFSESVVGVQVLSGGIPQVVSGENNTASIPTAVNSYSGLAPEANTTENRFSQGLTGSHSLVGNVPSAVTTENNRVDLPVGSTNYSGLIPQAITSEGEISQLPAGSNSQSGIAPSISTTENRFATVPVGSHTLSGNTASIVTTENNFSQLPVGTNNYSGIVPEAVSTEGETSQVPQGMHVDIGAVPSAITTENTVSQIPSVAQIHTGNVPQAVTEENRQSNIPLGTKTYTGLVPQAITSEGEVAQIPSGGWTRTGNVTTQVTTENHISQLVLGAHTLIAQTPTIVTTGDEVVPRNPRIYKVFADAF